MLPAQRIREQIDRRALLALARALIRVPTENPPGAERAAALLLERRLRALGFRTRRARSPRGRWNLLAERGFGPATRRASKRGAPAGKRRIFLFNGHLDVVPAGDARAWVHPPYGGRVARGKLWGRGAADMKGGIAAFVAAVAAVARSGVRSPHRLALHLVSDEEALGAEGTGFLAARGRLRADLAVVGEPTGLRPTLAAKGTLRGKIHVMGRAAHAAIHHAALLVDRLASLKLRGRHPLLGRPTLNVGTISGGLRTNVVPPRCTLAFDRRIIPGETRAQVRRELAGVLAKLRRAHPGFRAEIEVSAFAEPSELSGDAEIVRLADEAFRALEGRRRRHAAMHGTTDARFLIRAGIPALILGPGDLAQAHTIDEFVAVEDLERAAAVYAVMLTRFLESP
jgi:acetylornithine deacetylase/succinyl-diaminopimelate desuccinylase family protein